MASAQVPTTESVATKTDGAMTQLSRRAHRRRALLLYVIVGLAFVIVYIASYPRTIRGFDDVFVSPRENVGYVLSERFADGKGFSFPLHHANDLPEELALALTPRDAAYLGGQVVPKDFAGTLLFHGLVFKLWPNLVGLVTPLFAVLAAFVLAKLAEELFDRRVALLAFILWLTYPPAWINGSYVFTSDTVALALMLSTFLFFCRYMRAPSRMNLVLMAVSYGAAISVRYPSAMIGLPLIVALLAFHRPRLKDFAIAGTVIAPFVATILIFNEAVYGGALTTGFHLGAELFKRTVNFSGESFFKVRPDAVLNHLSHYLVRLPNLLLPQIVGLGVMVANVNRPSRNRVARVTLLAASLLITAYYIPQDAWGSTTPAINASSLRYILPATAIWTIFLAWGAGRLWQGASRTRYARWLVGVLTASIVVANVAIILVGPQGLAQTQTYRKRISFVRTAVERVTEADALVMTRYNDKVIWPYRQTLTATFMVQNEEEVTKEPGETWVPVPSAARLTEVALITMDRGIPMYVVDLQRWDIRRYKTALSAEGLVLRRLRTGPGGARGHVRVYAVLQSRRSDRAAAEGSSG